MQVESTFQARIGPDSRYLCTMKTAALYLAVLAALLPLSWISGAPFEVKEEKDGVTVKHNGKLLARYVTKSGNKPIIWPIIGPHGQEMTRKHPMEEAGTDEKKDHPHHRSFWFTHGDVDGISFWHQGKGTGEIVHREFVEVRGGDTAAIVTRNDWLNPKGEKLCSDVRRHTFGTDGKHVWIDFDAKISAGDKAVKFGDTKEGCFGVRMAGTAKVDSKKGGQIVNSEGQKDKKAWGQPAAWCDYTGPIGGKVAGIAILNHPQSFRFPTHWHVRTYGLFTANPFGLGMFGKGKKGSGDHTLQPGESFTLHYRVLVHDGTTGEADVAGAFKKYSETKPATP